MQDAYAKEALKLQKYNGEYKTFCEQNGLRTLQDRISIAKWNRSEAAKASGAARTYEKSIDNNSKSGIVNKEYYSGLFGNKRKEYSFRGKKDSETEPASKEYLSSLKRLSEKESLENSVLKTNPNDYPNNCQRCVPAFEMRMRGYDVSAQNALPSDILGFDLFRKIFVGAEWKNCESGNQKEEIEDYVISNPDGSRFEIAANINGYNHLFSAVNVGGSCVFVDSMYGEQNAEYYFTDFKIKDVSFCRIDNLQVSNLIQQCIE